MRNTTKLLSVLALSSALGGCSMAGFDDFSADQYAQGQQSQYWGAASSGQNLPNGNLLKHHIATKYALKLIYFKI